MSAKECTANYSTGYINSTYSTFSLKFLAITQYSCDFDLGLKLKTHQYDTQVLAVRRLVRRITAITGVCYA